MADRNTVLNPTAVRFVEMIDQLQLEKLAARYVFADTTEFESLCRTDPSRAMQIYWQEILARAHLTAVSGILSSRRWLTAVNEAAENKHLLAFCAAYRGLIESSADTATALANIPPTLARDHAQITRALSGKTGKTFFIVSEIEDELIHFMYGRKLTPAERAAAPPSHKVRQVREYIQILEQGQVSKVVDCYSQLCDLTHPGASSVWMWLKPVNQTEMAFASEQDEAIILDFAQTYQTTLLELLMFAFNPAIVTLNVLNHFPVQQFHVSSLRNWDLSDIPLWQKCRTAFGTAG